MTLEECNQCSKRGDLRTCSRSCTNIWALNILTWSSSKQGPQPSEISWGNWHLTKMPLSLHVCTCAGAVWPLSVEQSVRKRLGRSTGLTAGVKNNVSTSRGRGCTPTCSHHPSKCQKKTWAEHRIDCWSQQTINWPWKFDSIKFHRILLGFNAFHWITSDAGVFHQRL